MPIEAASSSGEEETDVFPDWATEEEETDAFPDCEMAEEEEEEEEETDVFTDWAMEEAAVFPDWAMLDRMGRTRCHKDLDAARLVVSKNKTAARLRIDRGLSLYVSFTLAAPGGVSYLNLHWPSVGEGSDAACSFVRATDKDLVLFDIDVPTRVPYFGAPPDLFVYTAAGPSPSVQQLPLYPKERMISRRFLMGKFTTGILRLSDKRYIVADLSVQDGGALCVFNSSQTKEWKTIPITPGQIRWHPPQQNQSSGQLPNLWSTDNVLAFNDRFLCWVDYFSGVLLSDFSSTLGSPMALHFVPFPGEEYPEEVRGASQFPGRFRSVSITQGKMCFVHIDNDFHEETSEDDCPCLQVPGRRRSQPQQHLGPKKITIWTFELLQLIRVQVGAAWCDQP
ncbi:uncharacterized protein LOC119312288 [Triticum dicoccoides]|uniref:uncharacterized protein LOC119312288 n=1 Tax=Triticum dicoccoides TaxID=85692 RepID=UPI0018916E99|nr:uncharacterized protein LOC119312288 [Triticum dicoccoides]